MATTENSSKEIVEDSKLQPKELVTSYTNSTDVEQAQIGRTSSVLNVIVSGLALFSDGYNAQISKLINLLPDKPKSAG